MRLLAGALVGLALIASSASAAVPAAWVDESVSVARAYWGGALPPCGQPTVNLAWSDGGLHGGMADAPVCLIGIDSTRLTFTRRDFCALIAHEWGHLLGYAHTPGTVMDTDLLRPDLIRACNPSVGRIGQLVTGGTTHQHRRGARNLRKLMFQRRLESWP